MRVSYAVDVLDRPCSWPLRRNKAAPQRKRPVVGFNRQNALWRCLAASLLACEKSFPGRGGPPVREF